MTNTTYIVSRRSGGRANCAPDKRRISVTVPEETFLALQQRADANHRGLSGEASELIGYAVRALSGGDA
jgi:hypothetical protein